MKSNVVEFNENKPTSQSIIRDINENQDDIKHVTIIVTWDDDTIAVGGNAKSFGEWLKHEKFLETHIEEAFMK